MDEHDVDVRGVVQLGPTQLPERDDREALAGDRVRRRGETRLRHRGDLGHDLLVRRRREVPRRDPQHRPAAEPAEPVGQAETFDVLAELGVERRPRPRGDVGERGRLLRVRDQEIRGGRREPQQADGDGERLRPCEGRERVRVLGDAGERHAGQTRVGRGRQGPFERRRREIQHPATVARRPHASARRAELTAP